MAGNDQVLFISAGMLEPKKRDHILARRQLYLNYGALTLATHLKHMGHSSILIHGNHEDPETLVDTLCQQGRLPTSRPILLSIPSYFALTWAKQFCHNLKARFPDIKIAVGGRWVVGPDPQWLKRKIPEIDLMANGLAETLIRDVIDTSHWSSLNYRDGAVEASSELGALPSLTLDHTIVDEFKSFQPSIEVSRGCGMDALFVKNAPFLCHDYGHQMYWLNV